MNNKFLSGAVLFIIAFIAGNRLSSNRQRHSRENSGLDRTDYSR